MEVGGSSPLARGLLVVSKSALLITRIIPARAGFTTRRSAWRWRLADHPRSRGVYSSSRNQRFLLRGSSPLARGLRRGGARGDGGWRIIPARAGFTSDTQCRKKWLSDHPRSRGVYSRYAEYAVDNEGSSPLARGLPTSVLRLCVQHRIIPARAGFTETGVTDCSGFWDHPRSRGVY